jgi:signal transduction histidine kinase
VQGLQAFDVLNSADKTWIEGGFSVDMREKLSGVFFSVPVRIKIIGIMMLPVLILGFTLNYWIRTGLSDWLSYLLIDERVKIAMQAGSRSVVLVTVLATVMSIILTFLLMFILTKPLLELREVALRVAAGHLATRARVWANDEIGEVALSINAMIDRLVTSQKDLQRVNQRLEAMNRVAMAAGRELKLKEVLEAVLRGTLEAMGFQSGWIFLQGAENSQFRLATACNLPEDIDFNLRRSSDELCACQEDLLADKLGQIAVVRRCRQLRSQGSDSPSYGHISIPLEARNQRFGVINLLCLEAAEIATEDIELLTAIGAQASEIVANAWLHTRLAEKEAARQALLSALVKAQEDERTRLARELHDGAGQTLTSLLIRLKTLEKKAGSDHLRQSIEELCDSVSETIEQVREISYRLRPAALEEFGLELALQTLIDAMAGEAGLEVEYHHSLEGRSLPPDVETMLYRIVQESLTNVLRHAEATRVLVELTVIPYAVCLRVEDNGKGFDPETLPAEQSRRRLGLIDMQERAEMQGGSLLVYSAPGAGTSVQVRVPLQQEGKS